MILISAGLLGGGGTVLWADLVHRDSAGYVTTDVHVFSTAGSALVTEPIVLGDPGVSWFYSTVVLGQVRIRVTPQRQGSPVFVGIGPTTDVDRYLAGVSRTVISDFWTDTTEPAAGRTSASAPGSQHFWVASTTGSGPQTLTWNPANGSWTVVVMKVDGGRAVRVAADLGATMPSVLGIAIGVLVMGAVFLIGALLLIVGAIRRAGSARKAWKGAPE